jgi:hypothetical protein
LTRTSTFIGTHKNIACRPITRMAVFQKRDSLVLSLARKLDARPTLRLASDDQPIFFLSAVKILLQ